MQSFYSVDSSPVNTNTTVFHRFIAVSFTYKPRTYRVWVVDDNVACINTHDYVKNLPEIRYNSYVKAHVTNHGPLGLNPNDRIEEWPARTATGRSRGTTLANHTNC